MDEAGIKKILEAIGCERIRTRGTGRAVPQVVARCPFIGLHKRGDKMPSFAVGINPGGPSGYSCLACGANGRLLSLLDYLEKHINHKFPKELHDFVETDAERSLDVLSKQNKGAEFWRETQKVAGVRVRMVDTISKIPVKPVILPESDITKFKDHTLESLLYLTGPSRKLTTETIKHWELGWDEESRRIVIPIRDVDGNLVAFSKRLYEREGEKRVRTNGKSEPKYLHSKGFYRDLYLFGERFKTEGRRAFLVEGFFHVIWMYQLGYRNVLALMGTFLSDVQKKKIKKWFDEVVIVVDGDDPGRAMAKTVKKSLEPDVKVSMFECPDGADANDQSPEELVAALGPPDVLVI